MCFSPEVTLTTWIIEWLFAWWAWAQYRTTQFGRLLTAILVLLGGYQLTEFMVCQGNGQPNVWWGRVGFVMISFLPILGLHATVILDREFGKTSFLKVSWWGVKVGYIVCALLSALFLLWSSAISSAQCMPNYILYGYNAWFFQAFGWYYFLYLFWSLAHLVELAMEPESRHRQISLWLAIGYLSFIVPTFVVTTVLPAMMIGFPSVLCGFAIFFSFIIVGRVLPLYHQHLGD